MGEKERIAFRGTRDTARTASRVIDVDCLPNEVDPATVSVPDENVSASVTQDETFGTGHLKEAEGDQSDPIIAHLVDEGDIEKRIIQEKSNEIRNQLIEEAAVAVEVKSETWLQKHKLSCFLCVFCLVVLAVVLGLTLPSNDDALLSGYDYLVELVSPISTEDVLFNETTPQHKALRWLAFEDGSKIPQDSSSASILKDRFLVALMYFGMGGDGWLNQLDFLSNSSVCEWPPIGEDEASETSEIVGIRCDSDGLVNHIRLGK